MSAVMSVRVTTVGEMKQRMASKSRAKQKSITSYPTLSEALVARSIDLDYMKKRDYFVGLVSAEQTKILVEQSAANNISVGVTAVAQTGRRFDKVVVMTINPNAEKEKDRVKQEVRFFIEQSTRTIYGPKSDDAPNPKQYYGTLDTVDKWDWSGNAGEPKDLDENGVSVEAMVRHVGSYGTYKHFEPLTPSELKKQLQKA